MVVERSGLRGGEREKSLPAAWGDFHARSRFARSTIPEEKWGTRARVSLALLSLRKNGGLLVV